LAAGPAAARERYRDWAAAVAVDDLDAAMRQLAARSAQIIMPVEDGRTGRFLCARHAEGSRDLTNAGSSGTFPVFHVI
jgi:hypothetical protein